nr:RQC domain-containing protein [uncultured Methanobacterium sp.]
MDEHPDKDNNSKVPSKVETIGRLIVSYESVTARIILYCIDELPFPVSENNLIRVLRGSKSRFVRDNNLSNLTSYRILVNFSKKRLKRFIRTLKKEGLLESREYSYYSKFILSPHGRKFIYSDDPIVTGYFDEVHGRKKVSENDIECRIN